MSRKVWRIRILKVLGTIALLSSFLFFLDQVFIFEASVLLKTLSAWLFPISIVFILSIFLCKSAGKTKFKRNIFSFISAFLLFPVPIPAGTIAAVLRPNLSFLTSVIASHGVGGIGEIGAWYFKAFIFVFPAFVIVLGISWFVATKIFSENGDFKEQSNG